RREPLRELEDRLRQHPRVEVDDLVERPAERLDDPRMAMSERRADLTRGEVEDAPAVAGLQPGAFRPLDDERREPARVADQEPLARVAHTRESTGPTTARGRRP